MVVDKSVIISLRNRERPNKTATTMCLLKTTSERRARRQICARQRRDRRPSSPPPLPQPLPETASKTLRKRSAYRSRTTGVKEDESGETTEIGGQHECAFGVVGSEMRRRSSARHRCCCCCCCRRNAERRDTIVQYRSFVV